MLNQVFRVKKNPVFSFSSRPARSIVLFIFLLISASALQTSAQQQQQQSVSIDQLKKKIALLESVNNDVNTTQEVKTINQKIQRENRIRLQTLLKNQITSLQQYLSKVENTLTDNEKQLIQTGIANLKNDLKDAEDKSADDNSNPNDSKPNSNHLSSTKLLLTAETGNLTQQSQATNQNTRLTSSNQLNPVEPKSANQATVNQVQADCYPDAPRALTDSVTAVAQVIVRRNDPTEITGQFFPILFFATAHAISVDAVDVDAERRDLINRIEIRRLQQQTRQTNKQIGASPRSEGSTSAIEKPGFAEILGLAVENGTIQQEVDGTTLTLSTSPYSFITAIQKDNATTYKSYGYLTRVGISASFNISNQDNVLQNATREQLSEWNLRVRLTKDRSMRSTDALNIWNEISAQFAQPALVLTGELAQLFQSDRELEAKRREIVDSFLTVGFTVPVQAVLNSNATDEEKIAAIAKLILCRVKSDIFDKVRSGEFRIPASTRKRIIETTLPAFVQALANKEAAIKTFEEQLEALTFKPTLTFAYTNKHEAESSDYSVFKLLFQKKTGDKLNLIANAGFSIYHQPNRQMNQRQIRDFAAALSFEGVAGRSPFLSEELDESQITVSLTARYQRLFENRGVVNKKADLLAGQLNVEIPFLTGVTFPFSLTYTNASEVARNDRFKVNFGIKFDTDKLLQVLQLKKLKAP
jgi:hypothetical protein